MCVPVPMPRTYALRSLRVETVGTSAHPNRNEVQTRHSSILRLGVKSVLRSTIDHVILS